MEPPIERLIREIQEETQGTKREALGQLIIESIRELSRQNDENSNAINAIIKRRDTGRMDVDV